MRFLKSLRGMEGRMQNFEELLADFRSKIEGAKYVAIDTELTGADIAGQTETFEDEVGERLSRLCDIAERHVLTQLGLTVARDHGTGIQFITYSVLCFPGTDRDSFECRPTALRFMRQHGLDLNAWVDGGVQYVCRETAEGSWYNVGDDPPEQCGLLRLWHALIKSERPLVFHTPLDLLFLLSAFECRTLPRNPQDLTTLVKNIGGIGIPCIFDTALLHLVVPALQAKPQKLLELTRTAQAVWQQALQNEAAADVNFTLEERTQQRYGQQLEVGLGPGNNDSSCCSTGAHEAGFDSLLTAMLFMYLWAISGTDKVNLFRDRLFLFQSAECLPLKNLPSGDPGRGAFDFLDGTVLVATMSAESRDVSMRTIAGGGHERCFYRKMDESRLLVFVHGKNDQEIVEHTRELAVQMPGVFWEGLDAWRNSVMQRRAAAWQANGNAARQQTPLQDLLQQQVQKHQQQQHQQQQQQQQQRRPQPQMLPAQMLQGGGARN
eukprot:CAMPEP_0203843852 /NCGR_PEP_ID=MMETSP0359-20131031/2836_1 /ASSEMBLY_ACC=CAM_ASM_000338 /TAXON_ID=268821 /ORGANISM="Scrippsiella Hangoei, Strain SHTV-5" /LENGTH=491 /DNA_ID=CAMNT_0050758683 /DNA_START=27 /DNA_END=1499 /DNA_ORIENTATION=-